MKCTHTMKEAFRREEYWTKCRAEAQCSRRFAHRATRDFNIHTIPRRCAATANANVACNFVKRKKKYWVGNCVIADFK